MTNVLVTGAKGQLGSCIKKLSRNYADLNFVFFDSKDLNITHQPSVNEVFQNNNFDFCVNCAAYTAVDQAEIEADKAYLVNSKGAQIIAQACDFFNIKLIHISTDFVFDGLKNSAYIETDTPSPVSIYGKSKLEGEQLISSHTDKYFIIRTSWLYSEFGNNFVKTMLRLGQERPSIDVVNDQIGSPTYAQDLAKVILTIIRSNSEQYGLYHYSNNGEISWYDFASKIFEFSGISVLVNPINSIEFKTLAKRPSYSVLSNQKILKTFNVSIYDWKKRLKEGLNQIL